MPGRRRRSGRSSPIRNLYLAVLREDRVTFDTLLQSPDIDVNWGNPREHGFTALHAAAYYGLEYFVTELVAKLGINVNAESAESHSTPLFFAARENQLSAVRLLVADQRTDVNHANEDARTPLWIASREGHIDIVRLLVNERPENYISTSPEFQFAIAVAREHNKRRVVHFLEGRAGIDHVNLHFATIEAGGQTALSAYNQMLRYCGLEPQNSLRDSRRVFKEFGSLVNIYDYVAWAEDPENQPRPTFTFPEFVRDIRTNRNRIFPLEEAKSQNLKLLLVSLSPRNRSSE